MRKNLPTMSQTILLLVFSILFGFSMYALYKFSAGTWTIRLAWPWMFGLVVSTAGLLALARDQK